VFWLPTGLSNKAFERRAAEQQGGPPQNPAFCIGSAEYIANWLGRLLGTARIGLEPPLFTYERLSYEGSRRVGGDIICNKIIPEASSPLKDRYEPPELEPMYFGRDDEFEKCVKALSYYDCGIFALHNICAEIDDEGRIPPKFVNNIRLYDRLLRERAREFGLSLDRIIRLGIVATTSPQGHLYRYPRRWDEILAQWRFIAVSIEYEGQASIVPEHVDSLRVELDSLISCQPAQVIPARRMLA
jgi:hypothetical protein